MPTHAQLKMFFAAVLVALATLRIVTAPARVMGAGQSKSPAVVGSPQDARTSGQVLQPLPRADNAERVAVSRSQNKLRDAHPSPGSLSFLAPVTYLAGGYNGTSVTAADVNGDGRPDLITTNQCQKGCLGNGNVGVLLDNGDGTFQPAVSYDSGGVDTDYVAVADLNGDGKPDLAVANGQSGSLAIFLGNGDGSFQAAVTYGSGGIGPNSVVAADVNGDGKLDLVVANGGSPNVSVLLGNGDGTFQAAVSYPPGGGSAPNSAKVADVNGDGKLDILVALACTRDCNRGGVGILLGNGDGTFQTATTLDSGGTYTSSLTAADINRDGKPDLLLANQCLNSQSCKKFGSVSVLLGNGNGTFQTAVTYLSGGSAAFKVAVGDLNGDGLLDVAVVNLVLSSSDSNTFDVLLGNGDGTLQPAISFASGGNGPFGIALADLNGDAKLDIVVMDASGNGNDAALVGVLLNNTTISKSGTSTSLASSLNPSTYGQKVTWTATVTSSGSVTPTGKVQFTWNGHTIGSATLNSSGVATLTKSNLNADTYPLTAVYAGDAANLGSTSAVLNQVVLEATSTATLTSSPNPSALGQAVTFTAKISSPTVTPRGPVTFTAGKTVLGTGQLSGGKATLTISSLAVGSNKVTATYYGDSDIAKSSASVVQTVQ